MSNCYEMAEIKRTAAAMKKWNVSSRLANQAAWLAKVERQKMTDGSTAYNVLLSVDGTQVRLRLACQTAGHANELMKNINNCSYVERALRGE